MRLPPFVRVAVDVFALYALTAILAAKTFAAEPECLPAPLGPGVDLHVNLSVNGMWAWWWCPRADGMEYLTRYVGTWVQTMRQVGDRIDTIRKAADPLAAARAAHKRYATLPLTDPTLSAVYADYLADQRSNP